MTPEQQGALDAARKRLQDKAIARARARLKGAEPSGLDYLKQAGYGIGRGLATALDAPGEAFDRYIYDPAFEAITGRESEAKGERRGLLSRQLRGEFNPIREARTPGERIAAFTGEQIGLSAPYAAAPFAIPAFRAATAGGAALNTLGQMTRAAPAATALGELAATTAGSIAGGTAREMGSSPGAEMLATMAGATVPSIASRGMMGLAIKGGQIAKDRFSGEASRRASERFVQDTLGDEMTARARESLQETQRLRGEIPGYSPTLAEGSQSPSLAASQEAYERGLSGQGLEEAAMRRAANEAAIGNYARDTGFDGEVPEAITDAVSGRMSQVGDTLEAQRQALRGRQEGLAAGIPATDRTARGQALREKQNQLRSEASADMSRRADELGILDDDLSEEFIGLTQEVRDRYRGFKTKRTPPNDILNDMKADVERIRGPKPEPARTFAEMQARPERRGKPYTFADFKKFRERLGRDFRSAISGTNPDRNRAREINELIDDVDDVLDGLAAQNEQYRQFRDDYRTQFINRFEDGAAFKAKQRDGRNFYQTRDEKVGSLYFAPGDESGADQFNRVFQGDPAAQADLTSYALDSLRDAAVRDGVLDQNRFQTWLRRHRTVLDRLPFVRQRVQDIETANESMALRQAQLQNREEAIARQWISRMNNGRTPEEVVNNAMKSPDRMRSLMKTMDEPGKRAVRQMVWGNIADGDADSILNFMSNNSRVLPAVFSEKHLQALRNIAAARKRLETVRPPRGRDITSDPLKAFEERTGFQLSQGLSRYYAYVSGRLNRAYLMSEAAGRFLQGRSRIHTAALMKEALYDEQVAVDLANAASFGKESKTISQRLNDALMRLGVRQPRAYIAPAATRAYGEDDG